MDGKELKKVLASLGIATLVSAVGVTVPSQLHAGSGWGGKNDGTVGADGKESSSGASGWGGQKDSAVSTDEAAMEECPDGLTAEECAKAQEEKAKAAAEAEKKKPGGSGWGGHK